MITKAIVPNSRDAYALRGQFLVINMDKSFILTHAAPTCGEIFRGLSQNEILVYVYGSEIHVVSN